MDPIIAVFSGILAFVNKNKEQMHSLSKEYLTMPTVRGWWWTGRSEQVPPARVGHSQARRREKDFPWCINRKGDGQKSIGFAA